MDKQPRIFRQVADGAQNQGDRCADARELVRTQLAMLRAAAGIEDNQRCSVARTIPRRGGGAQQVSVESASNDQARVTVLGDDGKSTAYTFDAGAEHLSAQDFSATGHPAGEATVYVCDPTGEAALADVHTLLFRVGDALASGS